MNSPFSVTYTKRFTAGALVGLTYPCVVTFPTLDSAERFAARLAVATVPGCTIEAIEVRS